ncbi:MAG: hypothetical protein ACRCUP_06020 [Mycoplasmatales bacterium]
MNELRFVFDYEEITFEVDKYNQLYIGDFQMFYKIIVRLKEFENIKFDDYELNLLSGSSYYDNERMTKKNVVVLDLNDFSKIVSSVSFDKGSLLRKVYVQKITDKFDESNFEEITTLLREYFSIDEKIKFVDKDPSAEKILDLFFQMYSISEETHSPEYISKILIEYLELNAEMRAIVIIDSSIKGIDYKCLLEDERIMIIDTSLEYNQDAENLIVVSNQNVSTYSVTNLIERIAFNWPIEISLKEVEALMKVYFHIVINDRILEFDKPTDNLLVLYVVTRSLLGFSIEKSIFNMSKSKKINDFIKDNMI